MDPDLQPILSLLQNALASGAVYDVLKAGARKSWNKLSAVISNQVESKIKEEGLPLNNDLQRGVRQTYLQTAQHCFTSFSQKHPQYGKKLQSIAKVFRDEEQSLLDNPAAYSPEHLHTLEVPYKQVHQLFSSFSGESALPELVERALLAELNRRFGSEKSTDAYQELKKHFRSQKVFDIFREYFNKLYKNNERLRAAVNGALLVQVVSTEPQQVRELHLSAETLEQIQVELESLKERVYQDNQELAELVKEYLDQHSNLIPKAIADIKRTVRQEHKNTRGTVEKEHENTRGTVEKDHEKTRDVVRDLFEGSVHPRSYKPSERVIGIKNIARLERFTGRIKELKDLKKLIAKNQHRLIQINGPSGVGKSTLVTKLLDELEADENIHAYRNC